MSGGNLKTKAFSVVNGTGVHFVMSFLHYEELKHEGDSCRWAFECAMETGKDKSKGGTTAWLVSQEFRNGSMESGLWSNVP